MCAKVKQGCVIFKKWFRKESLFFRRNCSDSHSYLLFFSTLAFKPSCKNHSRIEHSKNNVPNSKLLMKYFRICVLAMNLLSKQKSKLTFDFSKLNHLQFNAKLWLDSSKQRGVSSLTSHFQYQSLLKFFFERYEEKK